MAIVLTPGWFDLEHVGAQVAEAHGTDGSGQHLAGIEDTDPVECATHVRHIIIQSRGCQSETEPSARAIGLGEAEAHPPAQLVTGRESALVTGLHGTLEVVMFGRARLEGHLLAPLALGRPTAI